MKAAPLQASFASGEVSWELRARADLKANGEGLDTCLNMVSDPRGPVYKRGGFEHLQTFTGKRDVKLFPFQYSQQEAWIIVLTENNMDIIPFDGGAHRRESVVNNRFELGDSAWDSSVSGSASVVFAEDETAEVGQRTSVSLTPGAAAGEDAVLTQVVRLRDVRDVPTDDYHIQLRGLFTDLDVLVGTTAGASDLHNGNTGASTDDVYLAHFPVATVTNETVYLTLKAKGSSGGTATLYEVNLHRHEESVTVINKTTTFTADEVREVHATLDPAGTTMYFVHQNHAPSKLVYDPSVPSWTYSTVSFTGTPSHWGAGNYPTTMTFFQQRTWWGGTPKNPETFNGSKSSLYEDLTVGATASDGMQFTLANNGRIVWLLGAKNLLLGTEYGEYIVTSDGPVIQPGDIAVDQQSAYGSKAVQPERMGVESLYVSGDGRKLRSLWYKWLESGWVSRDLTFFSRPLTESDIQTLSYARNPDSLMWLVTHTGRMVGCTYQKDGDADPIVGWHRHQTQHGVFLDTTVIEANGVSVLIAAIRRNVNGVDEIHVESYDPEIYLDGYKRYQSPSTSLTGLTHLAGMTVQAVVDGSVHPDIQVDASGNATLSYTGADVYVGLAVKGKIKTLPLSLLTQPNATTGFRKRWNKIQVRVFESAMPTVNGDTPPSRTPTTPMNAPQPVFTGDIAVSDLGWSTEATITVEQNAPLPLTVLGIFGELNQERYG